MLYDYTPETGIQAILKINLSVKKNIVTILLKSDLFENPSEWWRCRIKNKKEGYFFGIYPKTIQRKPKEIATAKSNKGSRAHTISSKNRTS